MDAIQVAFGHADLATKHDAAGNTVRAIELYVLAVDSLIEARRWGERSPEQLSLIEASIWRYVKRAEALKAAPHVSRAHMQPRNVRDTSSDSDSSGKTFRITCGETARWADVVGMESVKSVLREAVEYPLKFPAFFTGARTPWRGILLYGPPGTGKTMIARATAGEFGVGAKFYAVSSADLVTKWQGESEKHVRELFTTARANAPAVIFVDEIDALCGSRDSDGESESSRRIKTEFMVQMDGMKRSTAQLLVLAATNTPYAIDEAMRRRFERRVYVPLPDDASRRIMIKARLVGLASIISDTAINTAAAALDGFSGADIDVAVRDVSFRPLKKWECATHYWKTPTGKFCPCSPGDSRGIEMTPPDPSLIELPPIDDADLMSVLLSATSSVGKDSLAQHEKFTAEFGMKSD